MDESSDNQKNWIYDNQAKRKPEMNNLETRQDPENNNPEQVDSRHFDASADSAITKDTIRKKPLVIAIANQKGGVAKTTTTVSLGGALTQQGKELLLVDLDAQANLTLALGKDPTRVRGTITDVLFHSATLLSVSRETSIPGLDLVPSNEGMELAERFLPMRKDYETILLKTIKDELCPQSPDSENGSTSVTYERFFPVINYDYVIMDCPPFMGAVTLNALVAADLLIIPTQPEFFSAHALRTMMTAIRKVRTRYNPDLVYRILITMLDMRNRIHRTMFDQIHKTFGEGVFQTAIQIDTKLRESSIDGKPIMYVKSGTRSAHQYSALAQEISAYVS